MTTDPLNERCAQLFAAARKEAPSEETRRRISEALRAERRSTFSSKVAWFPGARVWVPSVLAAVAFCVFVLALRSAGTKSLEIAAEPFGAEAIRREHSEEVDRQEAPSEKATVTPISETKAQETALPSRKVEKPPPPSLEEELAGMQRARAALDRGDATASLSELSRFDRGPGFRKLTVEANLLRIEALAQAGRTDEAQAEARRFVEKNPNNPLVDRAQKFTRPPVSPGAADAVKADSEKSKPENSESD